MSDAAYFAHPYVSNSDLSKLKPKAFYVDPSKAFAFGSLVHAAIMEPHRLNLIRNELDHISVDSSSVARALLMKAAFMKDKFCRSLLESCAVEVEMYQANTPFEYLGTKFAINTKRKYDLWSYAAGWGGDIKTTNATTQAGFEKAVEDFDYDRARVFYAKQSGATKDAVIGISKSNYQIFKVLMNYGDERWISGERKMNELAYEHWTKNPPF